MVFRACAAGVFVASLLACGGMGGPAPTERAVALAESRFRDRYIGQEEDDHATAIGFGDTMTLAWATYTPEHPKLREIDGETYLVVPYSWESTSPIRQEYFKINAIAWGSDGEELSEDYRKGKDTCEGVNSPDADVPRPPHYAGAIPSQTGQCEFLFKVNPATTDSILFLLERDRRVHVGQYIGHRRQEPWVVDLGPATPE